MGQSAETDPSRPSATPLAHNGSHARHHLVGSQAACVNRNSVLGAPQGRDRPGAVALVAKSHFR
jgi:hypothetical protein